MKIPVPSFELSFKICLIIVLAAIAWELHRVADNVYQGPSVADGTVGELAEIAASLDAIRSAIILH